MEIEHNVANLELTYAQGFSIDDHGTYKVLEINNPWPNANTSYRYAIINREQATFTTLNKDDYDAILLTPLNQIVTTSTTHIPSLELLQVEHTLKGFPGCNYISSEKTRKLIDLGKIRELGSNEGINTEVLLELQPEAVIGFAVEGSNKTFETIKKSGIPVLYNGDWVEENALAKAEWIKFFGVLFEKQEQADSIFKNIESNYKEAQKIALKANYRPTILSGAMHKDIWHLPYGTSPEAQLLKDANVDYIWADTSGKGSLPLNFETVFNKAKTADIWLSPSYYSSYGDLEKANTHYTQFDAFKKKSIYTFSNTTGKTGGVVYYELGIARPDLVLKDIIKVCHPELLPDYQTHFFKPLKN